MAQYKTPGVFIEEKDAFPNSVVEVPTSIPVFVGYTEKAARNEKVLKEYEPVRITSLSQYQAVFGGAPPYAGIVQKSGEDYQIDTAKKRWFLLYYSLRFYFANGGGPCWVVSAGSYGGALAGDKLAGALDGPIKKEYEPSLVVVPDAAGLASPGWKTVSEGMLAHCAELKSRFAILDVASGDTERDQSTNDIFSGTNGFYNQISTPEHFKYGAAYYPWLNTNVISEREVDYRILESTALSVLLDSVVGSADRKKTVLTGGEIHGKKPSGPIDVNGVKVTVGDPETTTLNEYKKQKFLSIADIDKGVRSYVRLPALTGDGVGALNESTIPSIEEAREAVTLKILQDLLNDEIPGEIAKSDVLRTARSVGDKFDFRGKQITFPVDELPCSLKGEFAYSDLELKNEVLAVISRVKLSENGTDLAGDPEKHARAFLQNIISYRLLLPNTQRLGASAVDVGLNDAVSSIRYASKDGILEKTGLAEHKKLMLASKTYRDGINEARAVLNRLPPAAAMAGVYARIDNEKGVHNAPANTGVALALSPAVQMSDDEQGDLNAPINGKAVNVIRSFRGRGITVWGARTLDANDLDWRYINVRRTMTMLEQSIKEAAKAYVFAPNTAITWSEVKDMISNYLLGKWNEGALVGATRDEAFRVFVGLGSTMEPLDILEGRMNVEVHVALSRPAEFIVITFTQQLQTS